MAMIDKLGVRRLGTDAKDKRPLYAPLHRCPLHIHARDLMQSTKVLVSTNI